MQKTISQIRDIEVIEKELMNNPIGVLALNLKDEKITQQAITFLYQDKNIYFFFKENDEEFEDIKLESHASFTIIKNDKIKKTTKTDFNPLYNILSITIAGLIKVVDDPKLVAALVGSYINKYSRQTEKEENLKLSKVIFIDTEEIQAYEEMGG
jgi:general stress protein 26